MFLSQLNSEQKDLFLDLCIYAAMANNDFEEEEKTVVDSYCEEMQLNETRYSAKLGFEEVVDRLIAVSSDTELRMISFEITALLLSDKRFDEFEKKFMSDFVSRINMTQKECDDMIDMIDRLTNIYDKIREFIFAE